MTEPTPPDDGLAARAAELAAMEPMAAPTKKAALTMIDGGKAPKGRRATARAESSDDRLYYSPEPPLKPECPITILGKNDGKIYCLSNIKELRCTDDKFPKGTLYELFGENIGWVDVNYPNWVVVKDDFGKPVRGPDGKAVYEKKGFNQDHIQRALIVEADRRKVFNPTNKVRGRGAHRGLEGELIFHCGARLLIAAKGAHRGETVFSEHPPGFIGDFVYPTKDALPLPASAGSTEAESEAILALMGSWQWVHPVAPLLLFGWLAVANLCGALDMRPHIWITGPSGCGKSSLQKLFDGLLYNFGLSVASATAAGIKQSIMNDPLPVRFDEPEAGGANDTHIAQIMEMARNSFSGAEDVKGSQNHEAKTFILKSTFLFSSIMHRELPDAFRNRTAILDLKPLPADVEKLVLPQGLRELGLRIRRRLMEQWQRWDDTLLTYQAELLRSGSTQREQDVYGTLLAAADILLHAHAPQQADERVYASVHGLTGLMDVVKSEAIDQGERSLGMLTSFRLPAAAGKDQETIARWMFRAVVAVLSAPLDVSAQQKLLTFGLRIVRYELLHDPKVANSAKHSVKAATALHFETCPSAIYLAVAGPTHMGVCDIFASSSIFKAGGWMQALASVKGAIKESTLNVMYEGKTKKVVLIPITEVIDLNEVRIAALGEAERKRQEDEAARAEAAAKARPTDPKAAAKHDDYEAAMQAKRDAEADDAANGGLEEWDK
jgi:hypothetical protein